MKLKLVNYKNFMKWCEQAPRMYGRVDLMMLDNKQKDSAVAAYCIDCGTAPMLTVAMQVISPNASEEYKNSAYQNVEQILLDLVFQYNDMLDIRDYEARREYDAEMFCEKSFNKVFGSNRAIEEVCHKPSDF